VTDAPFQRALVVRGGALGDFLLTLPVLHALRSSAPASRLEVLAYPGIASLARTSGLVDQVRSIEYGPLAGFFTRGTTLDPELQNYFGSFDLVVSYLYDPDRIFAENLRASGVKRLIEGPPRVTGTSHAIDQLAAPLATLGIPLAGRSTRLAVASAAEARTTLALHPGSGSPAKNWPTNCWRELAERLLEAQPEIRIAIVGGEADAAALQSMRNLTANARVSFWENLPMDTLASRLAGSALYAGHDTGISHLAAAAGTPCLLLFGPTDPGIWAPPHDHVRVLRAPAGKLEELSVSTVMSALRPMLGTLRLASGAEASENPDL
jgi:heptosyltransferase-2